MLVSRVGCVYAAEFKCSVLGEESKHLLTGKDKQSHGWNISVLLEWWLLPLQAQLWWSFSLLSFVPSLQLMQLSISGEKSSLASLVLFPFSGFPLYHAEIQLSFNLSPVLNGKAGDFGFFTALWQSSWDLVAAVSKVEADHGNLLWRGLALWRLNSVVGQWQSSS